MSETDEICRSIVTLEGAPAAFPTHLHSREFWEALGRTVATFGFLEETLGKAIFCFTGTKPYSEHKIQEAFENWVPTLKRALNEPLGGLIGQYAKSVREHPDATISNLDELIVELRKVSSIRNALCHGSWRPPDPSGKSIALYVNRNDEMFQEAVDVAYLLKIQRYAAKLACDVISTVTHMGWRFPGSSGPGKPVIDVEEGD